MWQNLKFLSFELDLTTLGDGGLSRFWALELDITESSALSIFERLDLARADLAKLSKGLTELSLRDGWLEVLNKDIGLWVDEVVFLDSTTNVRTLDLSVVQFFSASCGF